MTSARIIGKSLPRPNVMSLIKGQSKYLDDVVIAGTLHVCYVRSPYAHAKILSVDSSEAGQLAGVVAVFTGKDLLEVCQPWTAKLTNLGEMKVMPQYPMPPEIACWQGEAVVAVVAESRAIAEDGVELVEVEWEELEAVTDIEEGAKKDSPLIHPELETNVAWSLNIDVGKVDEVFENADVVVERRFDVARQTGVTLEPRGIIADWDAGKKYLTMHQSTQVPHIQRNIYARQLGLPESSIRVICPELGGGYGLKLHMYGDELAAAAISILLERPVKFVADRLESFISDIHARGHVVNAKIAVNNDGKVQAMQLNDLAGCGPYLIHPRTSVIEPLLVAICTPLAYDIEHYRSDAALVYQNKVSTGQYRGVGMPIASLVAEGLMDAAATAIGMDKVEIRKRNLYKDGSYPHTAVSGEFLEILSQEEALDKVLGMMDYDGLRAEQKELRAKGIYRGIGVVTVVEGTSPSPALYAAGGAPISSRDACTLRLEADGGISCTTGLTDQGQGGLTVVTQIVADTVNVATDAIRVTMGDTATTPFGGGTWASRGTAIAGEAALRAAKDFRNSILEVASHLCEQPADILDIVNGEIINLETGETQASLADVGELIHFKTHELPADFEPELIVTRHYSQREQLMVYANCALGVSLDVDINTGLIKLNKVWAVDDCGRIINEKLVAEQMRGGVVQGIGSTLFEECLYDEDGQLQNGNLIEYLVPMAGDVPDIECAHTETLTKATELGAKGCGEAGIIGICAALMNAINDALEPFDVILTSQPFTPRKILEALGKC